jgi:hypothetical protein
VLAIVARTPQRDSYVGVIIFSVML